jgi:hypothetical protein
MEPTTLDAFIDEFCKLAGRPVTKEEAERSLRKLKGMKEDRDWGTYGRSAAVGAGIMPVAGVASRLIAGGTKYVKPKKFTKALSKGNLGKAVKAVNWGTIGRQAASDAAMGAIAGGILPIAREQVEQGAQEAKLKRFVEQEEGRGKRGMKRLRQQVTEVTGV